MSVCTRCRGAERAPGDVLCDSCRASGQKSTRQMAEEGMNQAVEHADEVSPGWSNAAFERFKEYARSHREFMTEDARVWAHEQGLELPPTARAWGSVTVRAKKEGLIAVLRYENTKVPPAHAAPRPVWGSLIYGG